MVRSTEPPYSPTEGNARLKKDRQTIDAEDTDVVDGAYLVGIQQFYRACAGVKIVLEGDAVVELHDGAVGLPDGEVNGVGLIEHRLRGGDVDRLHFLGVCWVAWLAWVA